MTEPPLKLRWLTHVTLAGATILATTACGQQAAVLHVGPVTFRVELARTVQQQRVGLSGRTVLADGHGMLFPFSQRSPQAVWMAEMKIPIDIAWIVDGKVAAAATLQPCTEAVATSCPRLTSPGAVDSLLEVPAGALRTITPGTRVTTADGAGPTTPAR